MDSVIIIVEDLTQEVTIEVAEVGIKGDPGAQGDSFVNDGTVDAYLNSMRLNLTPTGTPTQGTFTWNADEETADLVLNGAVLQLGQEIHYHVRNNSGAQIDDGKTVMATGTVGASGRITIGLMDGSSIANAKFFLGIATEDIPDGEDGKISFFGKIRGIDTSSWNEGDVLWVDNAVLGGLTNVQPTTLTKLPIAFVVTKHAVNGVIAVRSTDGTYFEEAHDVDLSAKADGFYIYYDLATTSWKTRDLDVQIAANSAVALNTAKVSADGSIDTHSDVDTTGKANDEVLTYNSTSGKWESKASGGGGGEMVLVNYGVNFSATDDTFYYPSGLDGNYNNASILASQGITNWDYSDLQIANFNAILSGIYLPKAISNVKAKGLYYSASAESLAIEIILFRLSPSNYNGVENSPLPSFVVLDRQTLASTLGSGTYEISLNKDIVLPEGDRVGIGFYSAANSSFVINTNITLLIT